MSSSLKERIRIADVFSKNNGEKVLIAGWIEAVRIIGGVIFIVLRDRSGKVQAVIKKNIDEKLFNEASELGSEDVVAIKGEVKEAKTSLGDREIVVEKLYTISRATKPVPIVPEDWEKTNINVRLDWRFLDLRATRNRLIFVVTDEAVNALREFYRSNGFIEVFTPKIVSEATEGGAEVFPVIYFDKPAFLAQSPQLYKQMMMAAGFERVFEVGPAYRAEKHHTNRHLTEYESVDIEMSFIDSHEDVMKMVENAVIYSIKKVNEKYGSYIKQYFPRIPEIPSNVPRITLREAHKLLENKGFKQPDPNDLDTEGERLLGEIMEKEYGSQLFFVTEYSWLYRPFYTMKKPEEPSLTRSFDLIYRGTEIVSGSQREHRADVLENQIKEKGLNVKNFEFFIKFFRYGMPPHGGAGLGLERLVQMMLGLKNIREVRLLPRDPERLSP
ncbi:aspartate--tRNA(Asn) ligase [Fervidicoccus fontis]|uniref:Aspartate--tRNA ligase n=2 Tax=Fervidicoccus fontis TaxID=683846 RepID=I0A1G8_FERFK|nr:aspartate--tRNA(Asn) ligase [Fervidicoccus fontis]AFH42825.1 Aspartyl-tRNA synthetase [Fervidicoccus fontis Kam940]MBE9391611.1 aspartate--tRNA(Asn) ligase [Fervidicoccus fontis]